MRHALKIAAASIAVLFASACSHMPEIGNVLPNVGGPQATADLAPRERVRVAIELLGQGDERRAEAELQAALRDSPNLSAARRLLAQIDSEPAELLTGEAAPYTVRTGETMSALAERFQGDALLFYALARYNRIDVPNAVSAGQTLMIPRRPGFRVSASAEIPPAPAAGASPSVRGADPARASALRLQALQLLNRGEVDGAVTMLRRAQALDAGNAAIQRDLVRAERLQASLRPANGQNR